MGRPARSSPRWRSISGNEHQYLKKAKDALFASNRTRFLHERMKGCGYPYATGYRYVHCNQALCPACTGEAREIQQQQAWDKFRHVPKESIVFATILTDIRETLADPGPMVIVRHRSRIERERLQRALTKRCEKIIESNRTAINRIRKALAVDAEGGVLIKGNLEVEVVTWGQFTGNKKKFIDDWSKSNGGVLDFSDWDVLYIIHYHALITVYDGGRYLTREEIAARLKIEFTLSRQVVCKSLRVDQTKGQAIDRCVAYSVRQKIKDAPVRAIQEIALLHAGLQRRRTKLDRRWGCFHRELPKSPQPSNDNKDIDERHLASEDPEDHPASDAVTTGSEQKSVELKEEEAAAASNASFLGTLAAKSMEAAQWAWSNARPVGEDVLKVAQMYLRGPPWF